MSDAIDFLDMLGCNMPRSERLIFCGFPGDPNTAPSRAWRPRPWRPGEPLPINPNATNGYITVSSFRQSPDKTWRRRTDLFGHGLAVMVDDVGTKVQRGVVQRASIEPSAVIETSPGNEQWWWFLQPTTDKVMFDAVIKAFIEQRLLGDDPGMNGVNRVGRVPGYINGKEKYGGWRVKTLSLDPRFYTIDAVRDAFKLKLEPRRRRRSRAPGDAHDRVKLFMTQYEWMKAMGVLKHERPNAGGWVEIHCPWRDEHTMKADTGAAISMPNEENEWYGGFQCHHGHCIDRTWVDLCEWINDINFEELEAINARGKLR